MIRALLAVLVLTLSGANASAQVTQSESPIEPRDFANQTQEDRYRSLIGEVRCTVCQNEPIESSNAALAADLRQQVYEQIIDGRSDFEIRSYLRDRYGDFVLYNPPFAGHTLLLWLGPIALLLIGLIIGAIMIRHRRKMLIEREQAAQ